MAEQISSDKSSMENIIAELNICRIHEPTEKTYTLLKKIFEWIKINPKLWKEHTHQILFAIQDIVKFSFDDNPRAQDIQRISKDIFFILRNVYNNSKDVSSGKVKVKNKCLEQQLPLQQQQQQKQLQQSSIAKDKDYNKDENSTKILCNFADPNVLAAEFPLLSAPEKHDGNYGSDGGGYTNSAISTIGGCSGGGGATGGGGGGGGIPGAIAGGTVISYTGGIGAGTSGGNSSASNNGPNEIGLNEISFENVKKSCNETIGTYLEKWKNERSQNYPKVNVDDELKKKLSASLSIHEDYMVKVWREKWSIVETSFNNGNDNVSKEIMQCLNSLYASLLGAQRRIKFNHENSISLSNRNKKDEITIQKDTQENCSKNDKDQDVKISNIHQSSIEDVQNSIPSDQEKTTKVHQSITNESNANIKQIEDIYINNKFINAKDSQNEMLLLKNIDENSTDEFNGEGVRNPDIGVEGGGVGGREGGVGGGEGGGVGGEGGGVGGEEGCGSDNEYRIKRCKTAVAGGAGNGDDDNSDDDDDDDEGDIICGVGEEINRSNLMRTFEIEFKSGVANKPAEHLILIDNHPESYVDLKRLWGSNSRWLSMKYKLLEKGIIKSNGFYTCLPIHRNVFTIANGTFGPIEIGFSKGFHAIAIRRLTEIGWSSERCDDLQKTVEQMQKLKHINLLDNYVIEDCCGHMFYYTRLCDYNLEDYINKMNETKQLNDSVVKRISFQIVKGLVALHTNNPPIVHGNLKPSNVLIDEDGVLKLSEFGIFKHMHKTNDIIEIKKRIWWPSECHMWYKFLKIYSCTLMSDIQASGLLLHYVNSGGIHPYGRTDEEIVHNLETRTHNISVDCLDLWALLNMMFHPEPSQRPTITEVSNHVYFWSDDKKWDFLKRCLAISNTDYEPFTVSAAISRKFCSVLEGSWTNDATKFFWVATAFIHFPGIEIPYGAWTDSGLGLLKFLNMCRHEHAIVFNKPGCVLKAYPELPSLIYNALRGTQWLQRDELKKFNPLNNETEEMD